MKKILYVILVIALVVVAYLIEGGDRSVWEYLKDEIMGLVGLIVLGVIIFVVVKARSNSGSSSSASSSRIHYKKDGTRDLRYKD